MTWPVEAGGGGRSPLERFIVFEALIATGAPLATSWFADRQMGPTLLQFGTPEQQRRAPARHPRRHVGVEHRDVRARRRLRRRLDPHAGRARRRPLRGERPEDLELGGGHGRLDLPHRPHRSRRPTARRAVRAHRRHALAGDLHPTHQGHDRRRPLLRGVLRGRAGASREPGGRAERQLPPGDAADGARARAASTGCSATASSTSTSSPTPTPRIPASARRSPPSRPGTASAACWCCARCSGQAPKGFSAATKTFCTELEQRIAGFCAAAVGPAAMLAEPGLPQRVSRHVAYAPAYTIMGGTTRSCATSSASGSGPTPLRLAARSGGCDA